MRKLLLLLVGLAVLAGAGFLWVTRPKTVSAQDFSTLQGRPAHGEAVFHAAGCASCHSASRADGDAKLVLSGGQRFASPFGTFLAPNISPSQAGIGGWSVEDLANAMLHGTSPQGQ